jgi:predicted small secreted protein
MKLNFKSWVVLCAAFAFLTLTGTGCKNTAHGAGKDIEDIGEKIQEKTD